MDLPCEYQECHVDVTGLAGRKPHLGRRQQWPHPEISGYITRGMGYIPTYRGSPMCILNCTGTGRFPAFSFVLECVLLTGGHLKVLAVRDKLSHQHSW